MPEVMLPVSPAVTAASQAHETLNSLPSRWVHHVHSISHPAGGLLEVVSPCPGVSGMNFFPSRTSQARLGFYCTAPIPLPSARAIPNLEFQHVISQHVARGG